MPEDEVFDVIETIEMVENAHALPQAHALCVEFMLDGLVLVQNTLIAPAKGALHIAEGYWRRGERDDSLESTRVALWKCVRTGADRGPDEAGSGRFCAC